MWTANPQRESRANAPQSLREQHESPMKKPAPAHRRPQDVMDRFDRLLSAMAPKAAPPPKPQTKKKPCGKREAAKGGP